eukprot:4867161-Prymnesium_polylepis.2
MLDLGVEASRRLLPLSRIVVGERHAARGERARPRDCRHAGPSTAQCVPTTRTTHRAAVRTGARGDRVRESALRVLAILVEESEALLLLESHLEALREGSAGRPRVEARGVGSLRERGVACQARERVRCETAARGLRDGRDRAARGGRERAVRGAARGAARGATRGACQRSARLQGRLERVRLNRATMLAVKRLERAYQDGLGLLVEGCVLGHLVLDLALDLLDPLRLYRQHL